MSYLYCQHVVHMHIEMLLQGRSDLVELVIIDYVHLEFCLKLERVVRVLLSYDSWLVVVDLFVCLIQEVIEFLYKLEAQLTSPNLLVVLPSRLVML